MDNPCSYCNNYYCLHSDDDEHTCCEKREFLRQLLIEQELNELHRIQQGGK